MSGITHEAVERYLGELQPEREPLFRRLERYAEEHDVPIIGPVAGRFLYVLARIRRAKRILEAGTAIGYSTLWFARATEPWGGRILTLEADPEMAERARKNLAEAGVLDRVEIRLGDALASLRELEREGPFDLVFLDHAKEQYRPFLEEVLPRLEPGGVILADNVLRQGKVAHTPGPEDDEMTRAMREFNAFIMGHPELETVIVPLRDGIAVSVKRET